MSTWRQEASALSAILTPRSVLKSLPYISQFSQRAAQSECCQRGTGQSSLPSIAKHLRRPHHTQSQKRRLPVLHQCRTVQLLSQPSLGPQIATERPPVSPLVFSRSAAGSSFLHTVPQMVSSGGRKWWDTNCAVPNSNQNKHLTPTGREPPRLHR